MLSMGRYQEPGVGDVSPRLKKQMAPLSTAVKESAAFLRPALRELESGEETERLVRTTISDAISGVHGCGERQVVCDATINSALDREAGLLYALVLAQSRLAGETYRIELEFLTKVRGSVG